MKRSVAIVLLITLSSPGITIRLGPSVRYLVLGPGALDNRESFPYEESTSRLLFSGSGMVMPGFVAEVMIADDLSMGLAVYWRYYDPKYIMLPDSASYPLDRRGSISVFGLGVRKYFSDLNLCSGGELQYYREEWSDPFNGDYESLDSVSAGPSVCAGMELDMSFLSPKIEMGLVFMNFTDIQGRIDLSVLLP
jgi:hypothetical protein